MSRPYVSVGTCRESVCRGRWRHRPQPPIYRAYAPPETVREPFWRRSRTDDVPPDGPENRNEHAAEPSPATACRIAGRSRRSYRRLTCAVEHLFQRAHGDAQQSADLDRWNLTARSSRVGGVLAEAEISTGRLWHAECQFFSVCHIEVLCLLHGISRALSFPFKPLFPLVKLMREVYRAKHRLEGGSYGEEKTGKDRPSPKT